MVDKLLPNINIDIHHVKVTKVTGFYQFRSNKIGQIG